MKIRMKVTAAGPGRYYMQGSIVDLDAEQAELYIKGGYADVLETPEATVEVREAETAEAAPEIETAAKTKKTTKK